MLGQDQASCGGVTSDPPASDPDLTAGPQAPPSPRKPSVQLALDSRVEVKPREEWCLAQTSPGSGAASGPDDQVAF